MSQEDIDTVTNWLQSHGFHINKVYPSRMLIDFSGTAGQVKEAFHTEFTTLMSMAQTHLSNMSDPQIPAALAPVVKGIVSLNDFKPDPMYRSCQGLYVRRLHRDHGRSNRAWHLLRDYAAGQRRPSTI